MQIITPLALDLRATAQALSISYKTLRNLIYADRFPIETRKIGGRVVVSVAAIERFLNPPPTPTPTPTPAPAPAPSQKRGRGRPARSAAA